MKTQIGELTLGYMITKKEIEDKLTREGICTVCGKEGGVIVTLFTYNLSFNYSYNKTHTERAEHCISCTPSQPKEISPVIETAKLQVEVINSYEQLLLLKPISECYFSLRCTNIFERESINTIGDLVKYSKRDILKIDNLGKKSFTEIDECIENMGLYFGFPVEALQLNK